jgi:chitodextrinase
VLGDVDGDLDLDVITVYNSGQASQVWLNGGDNSGSNTGVFTNSGQSLGNNTRRSVALGDIDGDGDLDMVAGNTVPNRVWFNGGDNTGSNTGIFSDSGQALGSSSTRAVALGDIDGDGDLDLVTGNYNLPNQVWLNDY